MKPLTAPPIGTVALVPLVKTNNRHKHHWGDNGRHCRRQRQLRLPRIVTIKPKTTTSTSVPTLTIIQIESIIGSRRLGQHMQ